MLWQQIMRSASVAGADEHRTELPAFAGRLNYYEEREYRGDLNFICHSSAFGWFLQILWQLGDVKLLEISGVDIDPRIARIYS